MGDILIIETMKNFRNQNYGGNFGTQIICDNCGQPKHIARNCSAKWNHNNNLSNRTRYENLQMCFSRQNSKDHNNFNRNFNSGCHFTNEDELYDGNNDATDKVMFFTNEKCLASYNWSIDTNTVNFYLNSATTRHIVKDILLFSTFLKLNKPEFVTVAKKEVKLCVTGVGLIDVEARDRTKVTIKNVRY